MSLVYMAPRAVAVVVVIRPSIDARKLRVIYGVA